MKLDGMPIVSVTLKAAAAVLAGLLILAGGTAFAEPMAVPGDEVKARQLRLAARASEPGQWGRVQLRLRGEQEQRVFVRGLNVAAPLSVQVIAESGAAPVQVSLHRHAWAQAQAQGSTGAGGVFRFDGRAHGDVGIKLVSASGAPTRATVLVWQGAPVPRPLAVVYAAPGTERAAQAGMTIRAGSAGGFAASGMALVGVAVAAVLLTLGAVALMRRKRQSGTTVAALLVGVALVTAGVHLAPVSAQSAPDPFKIPPGLKPAGGTEAGTSKDNKPADNKPKDPKPADNKPKPPAGDGATPPNPFDAPAGWKPTPGPGASKDPKDDQKPKDGPDADGPPNPFDVPGDWKPAGGSGSSKEPKDKPEDATEDAETGAAADASGDAAGSYRERIAAAEEHARQLAQQVANNRAEIERLRLLIESDREAEPQPDRLPPLPLSCRPPTIEGDGIQRSSAAEAAWAHFERCQQCYAQPLADFERQLQLYEQLRVLYGGTRDFVTRAIDLGDKAPKPHTLLESAWAAQKLSIRRSFDGTKKAYDAKLIEFNGRLSEVLDRIGMCETQLNNNPMWRQTSGLFFHQTMATSYKRSD